MTELGLAASIRDAIRAEQDQAAELPRASDGASVAAYVPFLAQRYVIEDLLEQAAGVQRGSPIAGPFVVPELHRASAIAADLARLAGPGWRDDMRVIPATKAYVDRLREVAFTWPGGFVAHYCLRYLGERGGDSRWVLFDAAPWEDAEWARVVEEVRLAVRLNAAIVEELTREADAHRVA